MSENIKIIDVILHKNKYSTQTFVVTDRQPNFVYTKIDNWLIAEDSGFYSFYFHELASKTWKAFAGRKFNIPLDNGETIEAVGQWWDGVPEEYKELMESGSSTIEQLNECNVFCSSRCDKRFIDEWLEENESRFDSISHSSPGTSTSHIRRGHLMLL